MSICYNCGKEFTPDPPRARLCKDCRRTLRGRNNTKYRDRTYDRFTYYTPKGDKEVYQETAKSLGMSLNEFITKAVKKYMEELEKDKKPE